MKKLPLVAAVFFISALPAFAQSEYSKTSYSVDNFDLSAVHIELPPAPPARKLRRGRVLTSAMNLERTSPRTTNINWTGSLSGFTTGNPTVDSYIIDSGRRNSVDPLLLYAIMHQESTFKARAMSNKGARGLMQLMPLTAARFGVTNIFDPKQNIEGGSRYLRFLLNHFNGDLKLALAGYNAGEGAVEKYGWRIPPYSETQEYVRRISRRYGLLRDPNAAIYAPRLNSGQIARLKDKQSVPLNMYERTVLTVRLPDGRLQLMTQ